MPPELDCWKVKKIQIFVLFAHTHIGTMFAHSARLYRGISHNSDTSRGRAEEMHVRLLCFASESFTEYVYYKLSWEKSELTLCITNGICISYSTVLWLNSSSPFGTLRNRGLSKQVQAEDDACWLLHGEKQSFVIEFLIKITHRERWERERKVEQSYFWFTVFFGLSFPFDDDYGGMEWLNAAESNNTLFD